MNHQKSFAGQSLIIARPCFLFFLLVSCALSSPDATAQTARTTQKPPSAVSAAVPKRHRLRITKGDVIGVSLKANKARMRDVAADLSKALGTRVILGSSLANEALTVEFADLTLETALRLIAPHAYVDYEIRANAQPAIAAIFLNDANDPEPAKNAAVQASSEAILISGNTEDPDPSTAQTDDDPLQVDINDDSLTIKSKKQLLAAVVLTVGYVMEVPVDIKYESDEIIDTTIKDTPYEDAIVRLSPNVRLYVRADLTRSQRTPLRLSIVPPAKVADAGTN